MLDVTFKPRFPPSIVSNDEAGGHRDGESGSLVGEGFSGLKYWDLVCFEDTICGFVS